MGVIVCICYTSYHHHDFLQVTVSVTYEAFAQLTVVTYVVLRMEIDDNDGGE